MILFYDVIFVYNSLITKTVVWWFSSVLVVAQKME